MPIQGSLNSGWIFDSWEPSIETTTTNPNPDVFADGAAGDEVWQRILTDYTRHMIVQSPNNFLSAFGKEASSANIVSSSGDRAFTPIVAYNGVQSFAGPWICVLERLTIENAGDGTFRLEQTWRYEGKWTLTNFVVNNSYVPVSDSATDTRETENDAGGAGVPGSF